MEMRVVSQEGELAALSRRVSALERRMRVIGHIAIGVIGGACISAIILTLGRHAESPVWSVTAIAAALDLNPRDQRLLWGVGAAAVALTG